MIPEPQGLMALTVQTELTESSGKTARLVPTGRMAATALTEPMAVLLALSRQVRLAQAVRTVRTVRMVRMVQRALPVHLVLLAQLEPQDLQVDQQARRVSKAQQVLKVLAQRVQLAPKESVRLVQRVRKATTAQLGRLVNLVQRGQLVVC